MKQQTQEPKLGLYKKNAIKNDHKWNEIPEHCRHLSNIMTEEYLAKFWESLYKNKETLQHILFKHEEEEYAKRSMLHHLEEVLKYKKRWEVDQQI